MKTVYLAFIALALIGLSAQASTPIHSEFFWQSGPQKNIVEPKYEFTSDTTEYKGGSEEEISGSNLGVAYERGINDMFAGGVRTTYTAASVEEGGSETDVKGIGDIVLFMKGQNAFIEGSSLHYGTNLNVSTSNRTFDNKEISPNSGGYSIDPYVGYQWLVGANVLGISLSTELGLGDKTIDGEQIEVATSTAGAEADSSGGETTALTAFYEIPHNAGLYGISLAYDYTDKSELSYKGTAFLNSEGFNTLNLGFYSPYDVTETATVIGKLNYSTMLRDKLDGVDVDSSNAFAIEVMGRFAF